MSRFVLAPSAAADLVLIWRYVLTESSLEMANRVETVIRSKIMTLVRTSGAGHIRQDLTKADVRFFPVYSYLIVYRPETRPLQIVAILHGARNVSRILKKRV